MPEQRARKCWEDVQTKVSRRLDGPGHLIDCPLRTRFGIITQCRGSETIEQDIERRVYRDELADEMGRDLSDLQPVGLSLQVFAVLL